MRIVVVVASMALAFMLAGCSLFTRSIERPTATVRGVAVTQAGFTGVTGTATFDVTNPNAFGVPLERIDWDLALGDARAISGTVELSQTIPARGVAPVTTTLTIAAGDAAVAVAALAAGERRYQLTARLRFSTAVGPLDVTVVHDGVLDGSSAGSLLGGF